MGWIVKWVMVFQTFVINIFTVPDDDDVDDDDVDDVDDDDGCFSIRYDTNIVLFSIIYFCRVNS